MLMVVSLSDSLYFLLEDSQQVHHQEAQQNPKVLEDEADCGVFAGPRLHVHQRDLRCSGVIGGVAKGCC